MPILAFSLVALILTKEASSALAALASLRIEPAPLRRMRHHGTLRPWSSRKSKSPMSFTDAPRKWLSRISGRSARSGVHERCSSASGG